MNINDFLINANLAYLLKLQESPETNRTNFLMAYAYSKLPILDGFAGTLATKMITNGTSTLNVKFGGKVVTRAEYLLDSWFQVIHANLKKPHGSLDLPREEIAKVKEMLAAVRPVGAL